mmetsp:Transcript_2947/g.7656  ORF Transcript_2947/g.7656 Transcript_2947/m.7656 type:complete len:112 (+) Transcript_2947:2-337(+)
MEERRQLLSKKLIVRRACAGHAPGGRTIAATERWHIFPASLTDLGREVLCMPPLDEDEGGLDPDLRQAILLTMEAGEAELRGDLQGSVEKLRKAGKVWPDIEDWHDAIFGT